MSHCARTEVKASVRALFLGNLVGSNTAYFLPRKMTDFRFMGPDSHLFPFKTLMNKAIQNENSGLARF